MRCPLLWVSGFTHHLASSAARPAHSHSRQSHVTQHTPRAAVAAAPCTVRAPPLRRQPPTHTQRAAMSNQITQHFRQEKPHSSRQQAGKQRSGAAPGSEPDTRTTNRECLSLCCVLCLCLCCACACALDPVARPLSAAAPAWPATRHCHAHARALSSAHTDPHSPCCSALPTHNAQPTYPQRRRCCVRLTWTQPLAHARA